MIPSWVRPGAVCVCIDDNWKGEWECGAIDDVAGPALDDVVMILDVGFTLDGCPAIGVVGWTDFWELSSFRPLTKEESDLIYFNALITDSAAPSRVTERA